MVNALETVITHGIWRLSWENISVNSLVPLLNTYTGTINVETHVLLLIGLKKSSTRIIAENLALTLNTSIGIKTAQKHVNIPF